MLLRKRCILKYMTGIIVAIIVYCEWIVYVMQPMFWNSFDCQNHDGSCTKILFIADPQIQGDVAVHPPFSYLFNWDSDRYLRNTFKTVFGHFEPDVLVYLGDLMDEGSIATMQQFHAYVKRLMHIFDIEHPVIQVWIPGDNDIGGEHEEIHNEKVTEFAKTFNQPDMITFKNISIYKVNKITNTLPFRPEKHDNNIKIAISHYPIMLSNHFAQQTINIIHPDIFFCAHEHESKYMKIDRNLSHRITHPINTDTLWLTFTDAVHYEIYVPTCSYRMGTEKIGYGAAIIENDALQYTVFWSPRRFPVLYTYLFISIILLACFVNVLFMTLCYYALCKQSQYSPLIKAHV